MKATILTSLSASFLTTIMISSTALATSHQFKVTGMHCGGCKMAIEKSVCNDAGYAKCEARITNEKEEIGEVLIETKPGQKADPTEIIKKIEKAGYKAEVQTLPAAKKGS